MGWIRDLGVHIGTYTTAHPLRSALIALALAIVGGSVAFVSNVGGAWDYVLYWLGWNYQYAVRILPSEVRLGQNATVKLVREYKKKDGFEVHSVEDLDCAWFFYPELLWAGKGPECDSWVGAKEADFAGHGTGPLRVHVQVQTYRSGEARPAQLTNPVRGADGYVSLINQYTPEIKIDRPVLIPGQMTGIHIEFPFAPKGTPANPACQWSLADARWPISAISDPQACTTTFTAPRNAIGELSIKVRVLAPPGLSPLDAVSSIRFAHPPGRYFLSVLDYTTRMMEQWAGKETMFQSMKDTIGRAIGYFDDTGGGYFGATSFGGLAATAGTSERAPDCRNVGDLYPFGAVEKDVARKAIESLGAYGSNAPLRDAITAAYRGYLPYRAQANDDKIRAEDRFFFVVITGGGDTCGNPDLLGVIRDMMTPKELADVIIQNRLLRIVLATVTPRGEEAIDRLLKSDDYRNEHQGTAVLKVKDSTTLDRALTDLAKMASRKTEQVIAGCRSLEDLFRKDKEDVHGANIVRSFCNKMV
jgi:hypothetical protein